MAIALACLIPALAAGAPKAHGSRIFVTASWLAERLGTESLVIVDARDREAYLGGHPPGAISLPPQLLVGAPQVATTLGRRGLSEAATIVCLADSATLASAAHLLWLLELAGARDVRLLDGGVAAWSRQGGALETSESIRPPSRWSSPPDSSVFADRALVRGLYGTPGIEILDARGPEVWGAHRPAGGSVASRAGHIPHSLPLDFHTLLRPDGTVLDSADAWTVVRESGPRQGTPVDMAARFLVYDDGASAGGALGYAMLLHAGIDTVRYFAGGWPAWAADSTSPIVRIVDAAEVRAHLRMWRVRSPGAEHPSNFLLLDVRDRWDYGNGHLLGAYDFPSHIFADSVEDWLAACCPSVDRAHTPVVLYCYGTSCIRSRNCATIAARKGFRVLEWFRGGIDEWRFLDGELVAPSK